MNASAQIEAGVLMVLSAVEQIADNAPGAVTEELADAISSGFIMLAAGLDVYAGELGVTEESQPPNQQTTSEED